MANEQSAYPDLPFSAVLSFGKPVQKVKVRGANLTDLEVQMKAAVVMMRLNWKRELSGT